MMHKIAQDMNIVAVFDELENGLRARRILRRVTSVCGWSQDARIDYWEFHQLNDSRMRERALHAVDEAQIILLVCRGYGTLPLCVDQWMHSWHARGRESPALLAALVCERDEPNDSAGDVSALLGQLASRLGMDLYLRQEWDTTMEMGALLAGVKSLSVRPPAERAGSRV